MLRAVLWVVGTLFGGVMVDAVAREFMFHYRNRKKEAAWRDSARNLR